MNPQHEVERMLREHDAVLVRQRNHLVYSLPNGHKFVLAKTPSDHRAAKNNLSDLRRVLGLGSETKEKPAMNELQMEATRNPAAGTEPGAVAKPDSPAGLRARIEAAIAREEGKQERLLAQAQQVERYAQMLRALVPFADDPATEDVLKALMPSIPVMPPASANATHMLKAPAPPDHITARVQVTRQMVLAATQTFEEPFTVNDVLDLMVGDRQIDHPERIRVRTSIAQAMISLAERGELLKDGKAKKGRQGVWKRVHLTTSANRGPGWTPGSVPSRSTSLPG